MLAFDLIQEVSGRRAEIFIGVENDAIRCKLNHRGRARDRIELTVEALLLEFCFGDIGLDRNELC